MSLLPRYYQQDYARFDFRIHDALGGYVAPDWDDENLKVEFYDSGGELRFTATTTSNPALSQGEDYEGIFIYVDGIALSDFSLGVASAKIYCQVQGAEVFPYPTVIEAFEVVEGVGEEPVYTTISRVRAELPGSAPSELTDSIIQQYIYDASRKIDAYLYGYYSLPFAGIEENPSTPALIEQICRKLALNDCLVFLGMLNQIELKPVLEERAIRQLEELRAGRVRLSGYQSLLPVYQGQISSDLENQPDILD